MLQKQSDALVTLGFHPAVKVSMQTPLPGKWLGSSSSSSIATVCGRRGGEMGKGREWGEGGEMGKGREWGEGRRKCLGIDLAGVSFVLAGSCEADMVPVPEALWLCL